MHEWSLFRLGIIKVWQSHAFQTQSSWETGFSEDGWWWEGDKHPSWGGRRRRNSRRRRRRRRRRRSTHLRKRRSGTRRPRPSCSQRSKMPTTPILLPKCPAWGQDQVPTIDLGDVAFPGKVLVTLWRKCLFWGGVLRSPHPPTILSRPIQTATSETGGSVILWWESVALQAGGPDMTIYLSVGDKRM